MKKNPIDEFQEYKSKEAAAKATQDMELWSAWNESGRKPEALQPLMKRYEPLLNNKVREWKAPSVDSTAFKAELQKQCINAAHSYDPTRGVAFNTHLQKRLPKAMRLNTRHQNIGYIPEGKATHIGRIQVAQNELQETLGRVPTHKELAEHLEMPQRRVTNILSSMKKDVRSSDFETDPVTVSTAREQDVIRLMSRRPEDYLTADEAKVFKHIYGVGGAKKITGTRQLANELGMSQPRISRLKTAIGQKVKRYT